MNELSYKVPIDQVLKQIYRALKPEPPGLSSLIRLEAVYERTQLLKTERQKGTTESGSKCAVSVS